MRQKEDEEEDEQSTVFCKFGYYSFVIAKTLLLLMMKPHL